MLRNKKPLTANWMIIIIIIFFSFLIISFDLAIDEMAQNNTHDRPDPHKMIRQCAHMLLECSKMKFTHFALAQIETSQRVLNR